MSCKSQSLLDAKEWQLDADAGYRDEMEGAQQELICYMPLGIDNSPAQVFLGAILAGKRFS